MSQFINMLIFVVGTFISIVGGIWLARKHAQNFPEFRGFHLERYTKMAVRAAQYLHTQEPNDAKMAHARIYATTLFKDSELLPPTEESLHIAIASAMSVISNHEEEVERKE